MPQRSKIHGRVSTSDKTKLPLKKNHITNDKLVAADTRVYEMKTHVKNSF